MTSTQETSRETLAKLYKGRYISNSHELVINSLQKLEEATDSEIAHFLGYEDPNKVRPRRNELVDMDIVIEKDRRQCTITGKMAISWCINNSIIPRTLKPQILKHCEMARLAKLIDRANKYQLEKIKEIIEDKLTYFPG